MSMPHEGYQGWANVETWTLWMNLYNDCRSIDFWKSAAVDEANEYEGTAQQKREAAAFDLADRLKEDYEAGADDALDGAPAWVTDLFNRSLERVDWEEIARAVLRYADIQDDQPEEEGAEEESR